MIGFLQDRLPAQVTQIEGDFQSRSRELNVDQNGFAIYSMGCWRNQWSSERVVGSSVTRNSFWLEMDRGRSPLPGVWGGRGMRRINRNETILTTTRQTRTGIRTRVIPRIDRQSLGDSIVSSTSIPWIRSRNIKMNVARLPRTRIPFILRWYQSQ